MKTLALAASAMLAAPAIAATDDSKLVQPQAVIADASVPEAQRQAQILAARRYATFWHTGEDRYALTALAPGFVDRTLPPGRAQGVPGPWPRQDSCAPRSRTCRQI